MNVGMNVGMLWFMKANRSLRENVAEAASHYHKKYGQMPQLCLVNPRNITAEESSDDEKNAVDRVTVRPWRYVPLGHLWIGIEEMPQAETA